MKKFSLLFVLSLSTYSINVSAAISGVATFTGSLYFYDPTVGTITNTQCPGCDASAGEIDVGLTTWLDFSTGTAGDIVGPHPFLDPTLEWSLTDLTFVVNPDETISLSGYFLWQNYVGLTTSTFSQLVEIGPNGEFIALDDDMDGQKGHALIDGPFTGSTIYLEGTISVIPLPVASWLFGSGLLGLFGALKRNKST